METNWGNSFFLINLKSVKSVKHIIQNVKIGKNKQFSFFFWNSILIFLFEN